MHRLLPIHEIAPDLLAACSPQEGVRVVIEAPTGSGKSTQVPQILRDGGVTGDQEIVVLQPRRLAARMLARRVAWERGGRVGGEVGYQVRFDDATSRETKIRFVTEGLLMRQMLGEGTLPGVSAVVFDESASVTSTGTLLGPLSQDPGGTSPRLGNSLVMSARWKRKPAGLSGAPPNPLCLISSAARILWRSVTNPRERTAGGLWDHVAKTMGEWYRGHGVEGHALVFLPGAYEIRKTVEAIERCSWARGFRVLPLHGELSPSAQDAAVEASDSPKIVVATNVAETSLTIDGVRLVVDAGLERRSDFDPRRGLATLRIEKISRASADQRAGRAGRTAPGVCLRLWSEEDHARRESSTPPEIHRLDLSDALLTLKAGGIHDVRRFRWFEPPQSQSLELGMKTLVEIGAIEGGSENITQLGKELSRLPVSPRYGRMLVDAARAGCLEFFAVAAAATQTRGLFPNQKKRASDLTLADFMEPGDVSDFQPLYRAFCRAADLKFDGRACGEAGMSPGAGREMDKVARQFLSAFQRRHDLPADQGRVPGGEEIGRILLTGFADHVAIRLSDATLACHVVGGRKGLLEKSSVVSGEDRPGKGANRPPFGRLLLAGEMVEVEGRDIAVRLSLATRIREEWLEELYPDDFQVVAGAVYDEIQRRVVAKTERRFRDLVIETRATGEVPPADAARLLAAEVCEGRLTLKHWDDAVEQWIARINTLAQAMPELEFMPFDAEARQLALEEICRGAFGYKDIKDRQVWPALQDWVPAHQGWLLDKHAPERVQLPGGRSVKVVYRHQAKPKISVLIQHLFGVRETPCFAEGRMPLVVEILAPNHRPIQLTEDLAGFWAGSYAGVRAQLRGRYPKHDWPEPG
ncbi:MAG: ATP-dependent RNA helicase [Akkermansiaceae bacterium]|nr:ATP-dependent RNA helicase [Akkermansiaceae bacterium]